MDRRQLVKVRQINMLLLPTAEALLGRVSGTRERLRGLLCVRFVASGRARLVREFLAG